MHLPDLTAEFGGQIEVVDQVALVGQRDAVGGLAVALDVEYDERTVEMRGQTRGFADQAAGAFLAAVDHGQQLVVQQGGFLRHFVFHLLLDAQRHLL